MLDEFAPSVNTRVTSGHKETRWTQSPGATVVFPVPLKRLRSVAALARRIEQGQLWGFPPLALRNRHRLGVPLGGEGLGWELQVQAPLHISSQGPIRTAVPIHEGRELTGQCGSDRRSPV